MHNLCALLVKIIVTFLHFYCMKKTRFEKHFFLFLVYVFESLYYLICVWKKLILNTWFKNSTPMKNVPPVENYLIYVHKQSWKWRNNEISVSLMGRLFSLRQFCTFCCCHHKSIIQGRSLKRVMSEFFTNFSRSKCFQSNISIHLFPYKQFIITEVLTNNNYFKKLIINSLHNYKHILSIFKTSAL